MICYIRSSTRNYLKKALHIFSSLLNTSTLRRGDRLPLKSDYRSIRFKKGITAWRNRPVAGYGEFPSCAGWKKGIRIPGVSRPPILPVVPFAGQANTTSVVQEITGHVEQGERLVYTLRDLEKAKRWMLTPAVLGAILTPS